MQRRTFCVCLLAVLAAGCSHPAVHVVNAAPPTLPPGWTMEDDAQDGIRIGVPSGWRQGVDTLFGGSDLLSGGSGDNGAQNMDPNNPLAKLESNMKADDAAAQKAALAKLREKGIVLHIIDSSRPIPGEQRTRYTVTKIDHDGNWSLDAARDDEVEYYRGNGADKPTKVNLPIGPAYKFTCDHKTRGGDEVAMISYVAVDGKKTYCLRFISTNNPQAITSIADDVAKTWRITPSKA